MDTPVLDYRPRHDPRSLRYSAAQLLTDAPRRDQHWATGPTSRSYGRS